MALKISYFNPSKTAMSRISRVSDATFPIPFKFSEQCSTSAPLQSAIPFISVVPVKCSILHRSVNSVHFRTKPCFDIALSRIDQCILSCAAYPRSVLLRTAKYRSVELSPVPLRWVPIRTVYPYRIPWRDVPFGPAGAPAPGRLTPSGARKLPRYSRHWWPTPADLTAPAMPLGAREGGCTEGSKTRRKRKGYECFRLGMSFWQNLASVSGEGGGKKQKVMLSFSKGKYAKWQKEIYF